MNLTQTDFGKEYCVLEITANQDIRRRILDIGITKGTKIEKLFDSPFGEPTAFNIRGSVMALRREVSDQIIVQEVGEQNGSYS